MNPLKTVLLRLLSPERRLRRPLAGPYRGLKLHLELASETLTWLGLYEVEIHDTFRRMAARSRALVDRGASRGELACWWLARRPGRPVVAVEPDPVELALFERNLAANFSAAPAALTLWRGFVGAGPRETHRSLAELCRSLPAPLCIKLDIDGGEADVLGEAADFLSATPCRLLVEVHSLELEIGCLETLHAAGYRTRIINQARWRRLLPEFRPLPHNRWIAAWSPALA